MDQEYSRKNYKKKKKKKKSVLKRLLGFFLFLLLIVGGYIGYVTYSALNAANDSYNELDRGEKSKMRDEAVAIDKDPVSILMLGVENYSSGGQGGRADTIIVATLNPKDKSMKMLSIPRDTRIYDEEAGHYLKINSTYNEGKEHTIEAVENFLDIPIDYYVEVEFKGFKSIVDELGGVTVDVPFDFYEKSDDPERGRIYFKKGQQTLDGEEALAYARMRKRDPQGDFGRNKRQQQVISAAIDKMLSPSMVFKVDDIADAVGDNVQTNIRVSKALGLQKYYKNFSSNNIDKLALDYETGETQTIGGASYYIPYESALEKIQTELKAHLEQTSTSYQY